MDFAIKGAPTLSVEVSGVLTPESDCPSVRRGGYKSIVRHWYDKKMGEVCEVKTMGSLNPGNLLLEKSL
jgi:hypothetical protein